MLQFRLRVTPILMALATALSGCRNPDVPTEEAPHRIKDVSFAKPPAADTLVMGPAREIMLPDVRKDIPLIDGILNDPCWKNSGTATDFVLRRADVAGVANALDPKAKPEDYAGLLGLKFNDEGDLPAAQRTQARMCYGTAGIYVAFDCEDSEIVAPTNRDDGPILDQDDCVEFVINTRRNVFHIAVNPRGVMYTSRVATTTDEPTGPERWHPGITVATGRDKDKGTWQCEMAIPFASLEIKAPSEGSFCGLNIGRRNRPPVKHERYEMEEISTWSPAGYNILEPRSEGIMFFRQGPPAIIVFLDPGQAGFGYNRAVVGVRNRADAKSKVRLRLVSFDKDGAIIESAASDLSLPPKGEIMSPLNYKVPWESTFCCLNAALFAVGDKEKESLIGQEEVDLKLPKEVLSLTLDKKIYPKGVSTASGKLHVGVGSLSLGRHAIILSLSDGKSTVSRDEIRKPKSGAIGFTLDLRRLGPGSYTLAAELCEDAAARGKTSATFDIAP
ncbi:MAG: hypothetical protein AB1696_19875 [Planctomycetota bacterium]